MSGLGLGSPIRAPSPLVPPRPGPYLQCLGDPGFGGLVHLCLPYTPAARFAQMAQAEAQVLLVGVLLDLVGGEGFPELATLHQPDAQAFTRFRYLLGPSEACSPVTGP